MKIIELLEHITRRKFLKTFGTAALALLGSHIFPKKVLGYDPIGNRNPMIHDRATQERVLKMILEMKGLEFDPSIPWPRFYSSDQVGPDIFEEGFGFPVDTSVYDANFYSWTRNIIILKPYAGIRDLAHELTHYIQSRYQNRNPINNGRYSDDLEMEALRIGHTFHTKYGS